jgi:hypothetical protein
MPKIKKESEMIYKIIDQLHLAQIRIYNKDNVDCITWYKRLCIELNELLVGHKIDSLQQPFVKHYVWCLVQIFAYSQHDQKNTINKNNRNKISNEVGFDAKKLGDYFDTFEQAFTLAILQTKVKVLGIDFKIIIKITNDLLGNRDLNFSSIPIQYLCDFVLNIYIVENEFAPLHLLLFAEHQGFIKSKRIKQKDGNKGITYEPILRVGLYQEFVELSFYTLASLNIQNALRASNLDDEQQQEWQYLQLPVPANYIESKSWKRILYAYGSTSSIKTCPITSVQLDTKDIKKVLQYAANNIDYQLFKHKANNQPYKLGKILSSICAFYIHHFKIEQEIEKWTAKVHGLDFKGVELPLINTGDKKVKTFSKIWCKIFTDDFSLEISEQTIAKAYREGKDGIYPLIWDQWELFCLNHFVPFRDWAEQQLNSLDVEDWLEKTYKNKLSEIINKKRNNQLIKIDIQQNSKLERVQNNFISRPLKR